MKSRAFWFLGLVAIAAMPLMACGNAMAELTTSRVNTIAADNARSAVESDVGGAAAVAAANTFIEMLTGEQRAQAMHAIDDPVRPNWSNLPSGVLDFDRNGVRIADLDDKQVSAMFAFLAAALSSDGYRTVVDVVGADEVLSHSWLAWRFGWTDENYWLAFFGEPSESEKWGWQFGGHHLAVNVTMAGGRSYLSPTFVGVEPASYEAGDSTVAPMALKLAAGIELINAIDERQRSLALAGNRPDEVWAGAGKDGFVPDPEGSKVAEWNDEQRQMLVDAIALWIGMLDEASGNAAMAEIEPQLDDMRFAWHGGIDGSGDIYYRIQGPALIIEFSTQGGLGADAGHFHSIYRDPTNEYGANAGMP